MRRMRWICAALTLACVPAATRPVRDLGPAVLKDVPVADRFQSRAATQSELRSLVESGLSASSLKLLRYDPALEAVARAVGETWSNKGFAPARNVIWWLHWRSGVAGRPAGFQVQSTTGSATKPLDASLKTWGRQLSERIQEPRAWAVVRFDASSGDLVQALVLADDSAELDAPRALHAGQPFEVKGRLRVPAEKLTLHLEDDDKTVRTLDVPVDGEGRFSVSLPGPAAAGRRFMELVRLPPSPTGDPVWSRGVSLLPLLVDVPEPAAPEQELLAPKPNPADAGAWPETVVDTWNGKRATLGLAPAVNSSALAALALKYSQLTAQDPERLPDPQLVTRVEQSGIVSREVWEFSAQAEFLDELAWLSWVRPSFRSMLLAPEPPLIGVGIVETKENEFAFTQLVANPVGMLNISAELDVLREKFTTLRRDNGKPALARDASLDAALAIAAERACASGSKLETEVVREALARAQVRGASTWMSGASSRVLPSDLKRFVGKLLDEDGTHVAFAACQYQAGESKGRELLVVLVMTATPAATPAPAPAPSKRR